MEKVYNLQYLVLLVILGSCCVKHRKNNDFQRNIIWQYKCIEYFDKKFSSYVKSKMDLCFDKENAAEEYYGLTHMIKEVKLDSHFNEFYKWSQMNKVNYDTLFFTHKLDARLIFIDSPLIVTKWYVIKNNMPIDIILTKVTIDTTESIKITNKNQSLDHELKIEDGCNESVVIVSRYLPKNNQIDIIHMAINPEDSLF
jgi:hypothetical protein